MLSVCLSVCSKGFLSCGLEEQWGEKWMLWLTLEPQRASLQDPDRLHLEFTWTARICAFPSLAVTWSNRAHTFPGY